LNERLGQEYSFGNVVAYPRMLYVLVFACFVTVVSEERWWLRCGAALLLVLPTVVALATGGRGALAALLVAMLVYLLGQRKSALWWIELAFALCVVALGCWIVDTLLPLMRQRIESGDDSGRSVIYIASISSLSLLGTGNDTEYPHNLFLEFGEFYGVVGLLFLILFLYSSFAQAFRAYARTRNREVLWVIGLMFLQLVGQQFSLNLFFNMFWSALLLPFGFADGATLRAPLRLGQKSGSMWAASHRLTGRFATRQCLPDRPYRSRDAVSWQSRRDLGPQPLRSLVARKR